MHLPSAPTLGVITSSPAVATSTLCHSQSGYIYSSHVHKLSAWFSIVERSGFQNVVTCGSLIPNNRRGSEENTSICTLATHPGLKTAIPRPRCRSLFTVLEKSQGSWSHTVELKSLKHEDVRCSDPPDMRFPLWDTTKV